MVSIVHNEGGQFVSNMEIMGEQGKSRCSLFIINHQYEGWVYFGRIIDGYNYTRCRGFEWSHLCEQSFVVV